MSARTYMYELIIFTLVFGTIELTTNKFIKKCTVNKTCTNKLKLNTLIYAHYALYYFLYFTVFWFIYKRITDVRIMILYVIFLIYTLWSWYYYDNKCFLTVWTNNIIGANNKFGFRDPLDLVYNRYSITNDPSQLNIRDKLYYGYIYISIFTIFYIIYKKLNPK